MPSFSKLLLIFSIIPTQTVFGLDKMKSLISENIGFETTADESSEEVKDEDASILKPKADATADSAETEADPDAENAEAPEATAKGLPDESATAMALHRYKQELKTYPQDIQAINAAMKCSRELISNQLGKAAILRGFTHLAQIEKSERDLTKIAEITNKCEKALGTEFKKFYRLKKDDLVDLQKKLESNEDIGTGTRNIAKDFFTEGDKCTLKVGTIFATYGINLRLRMNYGRCISALGEEYSIQSGKGLVATVDASLTRALNGYVRVSTIKFRIPSLSDTYSLDYGAKVEQHALSYAQNFWGLFANHSNVYVGPKQKGPYMIEESLNIVHERSIDVGLSAFAMPQIKSWKVLKMAHLSDHWHLLYLKLNLFGE